MCNCSQAIHSILSGSPKKPESKMKNKKQKPPTILVRHVVFELSKRILFTNEETYTFV